MFEANVELLYVTASTRRFMLISEIQWVKIKKKKKFKIKVARASKKSLAGFFEYLHSTPKFKTVLSEGIWSGYSRQNCLPPNP